METNETPKELLHYHLNEVISTTDKKLTLIIEDEDCVVSATLLSDTNSISAHEEYNGDTNINFWREEAHKRVYNQLLGILLNNFLTKF